MFYEVVIYVFKIALAFVTLSLLLVWFLTVFKVHRGLSVLGQFDSTHIKDVDPVSVLGIDFIFAQLSVKIFHAFSQELQSAAFLQLHLNNQLWT